MSTMKRYLVLAVVVSALFIMSGWADAQNETGEKLFKTNCSVCHGVKGDSNGLVAYSQKFDSSGRTIRTYSRDFTSGVFKFRTTLTGCLPTQDDLMRIITSGVPKSFMPSFHALPDEKKLALIGYIKSLSDRWKDEAPCPPIAIVKPQWVGTPDSVAKGEKVFKAMKCWECHGDTGKGNGAKSDKLKDDWGHQIYPFDFTSGELKRGTRPEDIYITFTTGIDGTGMPSYSDSLDEESRWNLVSYTLKLMGR